jgi:hypothetical protein
MPEKGVTIRQAMLNPRTAHEMYLRTRGDASDPRTIIPREGKTSTA